MSFLEITFKTTALLATAWLVTLILYRRSAAVRHQVWTVAFAAALAVPVLSTVLPAWRIPVARSFLNDGPVWRADALPSASISSVNRPTFHPPSMTERAPANWSLFIPVLWALGATLSLAQMLVGWIVVTRLRHAAKRIRISEFAELSAKRRFELRQTPAGSMPITCGLLNPVVLLPADFASWTDDRRRVVLLHELAHIERHDIASHFLARVALAFYWWHPLVWKAWREFLKERESAADDLVLQSGATAIDYAGHLLAIARSMQLRSGIGSAVVAMARPSQLERRLSAILDTTRNRQIPKYSAAIIASLALACLVPVAALKAQNASATAASPLSFSTTAKLIQEGDQAREAHQAAAAKNAYTKALDASQPNTREAAAALFGLGKIALAAKNFSEAITDFESASAADPKRNGEASLWSAIAHQWQRDPDAADKLFQSAIATVEPDSPLAVAAPELYARFLREQNRDPEAQAQTDRAAALRKTLTVPPPPLPAGVYRTGRDVKPPQLLAKVEPKYSEDARLAKYSGSVLLFIQVGADGLAHNVRVIRALGFGLDEKAIEAINQWKFSPGTLNGDAVVVAATVEVDFRLF